MATTPSLYTVDRPIPADDGPTVESRIIVGSATDAGCVRTNNEDSVRVVRAPADQGTTTALLAIVCDGMGGHAGGEIASRIAVDTVTRGFLAMVSANKALRRPDANGAVDPGTALVASVSQANRAVFEAARADTTLLGMGTTCTALVFANGLAWCAHVGDSRCYLLRGGEIFAMTEDHSAVMALVRDGEISRDEARAHPDRNVISRALGSHADVEVASWPRPFVMRAGDRFLLCSDGLHDVLTEERIRTIGSTDSPDRACQALVAEARAGGAPDNVSVLLLALPSNESASINITRPVEVRR
jgi:protein phosphatase